MADGKCPLIPRTEAPQAPGRSDSSGESGLVQRETELRLSVISY